MAMLNNQMVYPADCQVEVDETGGFGDPAVGSNGADTACWKKKHLVRWFSNAHITGG